VIDGEGMTGEFGAVWERWSRRLPEVRARGTWREIGAQLAALENPGPLKPRTPDEHAADRLAFYEERFPFYADMIRGAAAALNVEPVKLAALDTDRSTLQPPATLPQRSPVRHPPPCSPTCMGAVFDGPDGPIHAYSKERSGGSQRGLGYVKIAPDKGYRYHMYTLGAWSFGYGVNSAGLSTSGATINCDQKTESYGEAFTEQWKQSGKPLIPLPSHMLLATCGTVNEALAFIDNPEAGYEFTGNLLLADRQGNAARVESVGVYHSIIRYDAKKHRGIFALGNYPHVTKQGRFAIGDNWGWAANTMLRERFLNRMLTPADYQTSLEEVIRLMDAHDLPGGMCQHGFENPAGLVSNTSCIMVTRTGEMFATAGAPCEVEYVRYTLDD
jgi:hypothetical protein